MSRVKLSRFLPLQKAQQLLYEKAKRETLKRNLTKCTRDEQKIFCYMYERGLPHLFDYKQAVDIMSPHDLNWANTQIKNTLKKKKK